jgi:hypothetical protein
MPLLLTLLSLTTKCEQTTTPKCLLALTGIAARFTPLVTRLWDVWVKHMIIERSTSAQITIVALHLVLFGLSYLYFPKGGTTAKMIE